MKPEAETGGTRPRAEGRLEPQKLEEEEGPSPGDSGGTAVVPCLDLSGPVPPGSQGSCLDLSHPVPPDSQWPFPA